MRIAAKMLCAKVRIGEESYWFIIDSGRYNSSINPQLAKKLLGTPLLGSRSSQNPNGSIRVPVIKIGAARLLNQCLSLEPSLSDGTQVPGTSEKVAGMLGYNLLRFLTLVVDFQECRLWSWGPGHELNAKRLLSETGGPEQIGRLRTASNSLPILMGGRIGSLPSDSLFDSGSYVSSFSAEFARRLPVRPKLGPVVSTSGNTGSSINRLLFVDSFRQGNFAWTGVPFLIVDPLDPTEPPTLGWTLLAPFGRVVIDFSGRTLYAIKTTGPKSSLDTALATYGAKIKDDALVLRDGKIVLAKTVLSFFGTRIKPKEEFLSSEYWDGPKRSGEAMGRLFIGTDATIRVQDESGTRLLRLQRVASPLSEVTVSDDAEDVPFQSPGYYLKVKGRTVQLPPGELWLPNKNWETLAIGGVPDIKKLPSVHGWDRFQIPQYSEDSTYLWKNSFGWDTVKGPVAISEDRSWMPKSKTKIKKDTAVAAGLWKVNKNSDGTLSLEPR